MKELLDIPDMPDLSIAVRTLTLGGFFLNSDEGAQRNPGYTLLHMNRYDEFGIEHKYSFAIFDQKPTTNQVNAARISANHRNSRLVVISSISSDEIDSIEWDRFINIFGGPVLSSGVLEPEFKSHLSTLGRNILPKALTGKADDVFEIYVRNALEFLFDCRVVRYGQNRRFEARPDGIVIQGKGFNALYDTKAYAEGYKVTKDTIRQFKSYAEEFRRRYSQYFEINTFIVISGFFPDRQRELEERSREMQAEAMVPLSFLTADTLGEIIELLSNSPLARRSIDWRRVFANPVITKALIEKELEILTKDKIIPLVR